MNIRTAFWSQFSAIVFVFTAILAFADVSSAVKRSEPLNKVVIIIDGSGSYRDRQNEAVERTIALLDGISSRKLHRWEPATDRITLISLDAIPEVLWTGSLRELKSMEPDFWTARFQARTDYAGCTDVSSAFNLAVRHLDGDTRYVHKYLFVFSDLIDEPPTDSIYRPHKRSSLPVGDFPWEALKDVSVSAFWVPPDQKLTWRRVVEQHGLESSFALYTSSESAEVNIQPPPRPMVEVTEAERAVERQRYIGYAKKLAKGAGIFLLIISLMASALAICLRRGRRRRQSTVSLMRIPRPPDRTNTHRAGTSSASGPRSGRTRPGASPHDLG